MSLSSQFEKSQADFQQATRNASIAKLSGAMEKIADNFRGAAEGIVARRAKGKEPTWFQKRKTEKWVSSLKGISGQDITPAFLEDIPGFRRLRDACADPKIDIKLRVYVGGRHDPSVFITVDPTLPFKDSLIQPPGRDADDDFLAGPVKPGRQGTGANKPLPEEIDMRITAPAVPAAASPSSADENKITVLSQLRLKLK